MNFFDVFFHLKSEFDNPNPNPNYETLNHSND